MVESRKHKSSHGDSGDKVRRAAAGKHKRKKKLPDDFVSVARRLGADEDKATFEAKLAKIAKVKPKSA
jgi:hypothetical protein